MCEAQGIKLTTGQRALVAQWLSRWASHETTRVDGSSIPALDLDHFHLLQLLLVGRAA